MKIICIGRNYCEHIAELQNQKPQEPVFFLKTDSCLLEKGAPFYLPDFSQNVQYECEIVVRINRLGKSIPVSYAHNYYNEISLGLDMTLRDVQKEEIAKGLPWSISKAFDYSAPLGRFVSLNTLQKTIDNLDFYLLKNGQKVQQANSSEMIFDVDNIISYLSKFITLKIGDIIFTGTPKGVGRVQIGDTLEGFLEGEKILSCRVK